MSQHARTVSELLESRLFLSASLVKHINTTQLASSGLSEMMWAGNVAFLSQRDNAHGRELWKTDGTAAGTSLVLDVMPGSANSSPSLITPVGAAGNVFFVADDGVGGMELWHSDGTAAGTSRVLDINPGATGSNPSNLTNVNGTLYFSANDGVNGNELWKSDGTPGGTTMVVNLAAGASSSSPSGLYNNNGTLLFSTNAALYQSDGTAGGTTTIVSPAGGPRNASSFTNFNGSLYFIANDATSSVSVWKSDGTGANTTKIYSASSLAMLTRVDIKLFFVDTSPGATVVVRSDGTAAGTAQITGTFLENVTSMVDLNGVLIYAGGQNGTTLKRIGLSGGTQTLSSTATVGSALKVVNDSVWFGGTATGSPNELFRATGGGVQSGLDFNLGVAGVTAGFITPIGGPDFLFMGDNGTTGGAIMRSAGTTATTTTLKDINDATGASSPRNFASLNGKMFFNAVDGVSSNGLPGDVTAGELWTSDGTSGGTQLLKDIAPGITPSGPAYLTTLGNRIIFTAKDSAHGRELWTTDGTAAGTSLLVDLSPGGADGIPDKLYRVGNYVYFTGTAGIGTGIVGVWRSDGTAAGTVRLTPNTIDVRAYELVQANGHVIFEDVARDEVWVTDGTAATTTVVLSGKPLGGMMETTGSRAIFVASMAGIGSEIWGTDGTVAGTGLVKDVAPGPGTSQPSSFMAIDGAVLFAANDFVSRGQELWRTDGTLAGTYLLKDIAPGSTSSHIGGDFRTVNGVAYFMANDGVHGAEPWRSDGTAAGTRLLKDINPGAGFSTVYEISPVNGFLYFAANDGSTGDQGWMSDGTTAGTAPIGDIYPGATSIPPLTFFGLGDDVYVNAADADQSAELFRFDAPTFASLNSGTLTINGTDNNDTLRVAQPGDGTIHIDFNGYQRTYALADVSSIVFNGNDASDTLAFDTALAAPVSFVGGNGIQHTVNVNAGTRTFTSDLADIGPKVSVNIAAGASAIFNATQHLASLNVDGLAQLSAGGSKLLQTAALWIGAAGQLDLMDNDLLATNTPKSTIGSYITSAYNFGGWDGTHGLFSSVARDNPNGNTTLGNLSGSEFADNNGGLFNGAQVAPTDVLVKYTYFGDVDFNGQVDVSDYNLIDFGFANHFTGWGFGDADYSGGVDVSDYNLIDFAFSSQGGAL